MEQLQVIKGNFEAIYSNDSNLESTKYLNNKIAEVERDVNNVKDFMKVDVTSKDLSTIVNLNQKLITYQKQIDETLKLVCDLKPELCSAGRVKTAENPEKLSTVFEKADQAVRQANIFIAIFDYQVKQISSKIDTSAPQSRKDKLESIQSYLGKLKTTVSLMETKDLTSDAYQKLDKEATQLINVISDSLVLME